MNTVGPYSWVQYYRRTSTFAPLDKIYNGGRGPHLLTIGNVYQVEEIVPISTGDGYDLFGFDVLRKDGTRVVWDVRSFRPMPKSKEIDNLLLKLKTNIKEFA